MNTTQSFSSIKWKLEGDAPLWTLYFIFTILICPLVIYSSTNILGYRNNNSNELYLAKQIMFSLLGFVLVYITHKIPLEWLYKKANWVVLLAIIALVFTLFFGIKINDARRWISLGFVTVQTSDFGKIAMIVGLSATLAKFNKELENYTYKETFLKVYTIVGFIAGFTFLDNLSTTLMICFNALLIMLVSKVPKRHLLVTVLGAGLLLGTLLLFSEKITFIKRLQTWKNRVENFSAADPEESLQAERAKIAIANGSIFGKGPGNSIQKDFLPHPYSDFVFALIIEEYGIIGAGALMILYLILFFRVLYIIRQTKNLFSVYLGYGLVIMLFLQVIVNMGVCVGIFPVTGQPMPLISLGGSNYVFISITIGLLLNISKNNEKQHGSIVSLENYC